MMMDRYTKAVLTVIALCLVWLSVGGPSVLPVTNAQSGEPERVYLSGWIDERGFIHRFPTAWWAAKGESPAALPTHDQH